MTVSTATPAARVTDLEVAYGEARALFGVSFDVPRGIGDHGARRQRRGQVVARVGDRRRRASRARARSCSTARTSPAEVAHTICQARARLRARVAQPVPAPLGDATTSGRSCGSRCRAPQRKDAFDRAIEMFPVLAERRTPAGGHALGRRAADARAGARAGGAAEAAHRRRDVARPRAADGRPRVRVARHAHATRASPCCSSSSSWSARSGFADEAVILRHGLVGWHGHGGRRRRRAPRRVPRRRDRVDALIEARAAARTSRRHVLLGPALLGLGHVGEHRSSASVSGGGASERGTRWRARTTLISAAYTVICAAR